MNILLKTAKKLPPANKRGRKLKYPFDTMTVGKYFDLPAKTKSQVIKFYGAYAAARQYALRQNPVWQFASRIKDGVGEIHRIK